MCAAVIAVVRETYDGVPSVGNPCSRASFCGICCQFVVFTFLLIETKLTGRQLRFHDAVFSHVSMAKIHGHKMAKTVRVSIHVRRSIRVKANLHMHG